MIKTEYIEIKEREDDDLYTFDGTELSDKLNELNENDREEIVEILNQELGEEDIYIAYVGNDLMDYSGEYYEVQIYYMNKEDLTNEEIIKWAKDEIETEVNSIMEEVLKTFSITDNHGYVVRYDYHIFTGDVELQNNTDYNRLEDDSTQRGIVFDGDFHQKILNDYDGELKTFNLERDEDVVVKMSSGSIVYY